MKLWADWLADNPRDHARCPGFTPAGQGHTHFEALPWPNLCSHGELAFDGRDSRGSCHLQ